MLELTIRNAHMASKIERFHKDTVVPEKGAAAVSH